MREGYRVVDTDSHVTPSLEVLHKYASDAAKARWSDLDPYLRTMNSPPGRGHPTHSWTTIKVNAIPYDRIAGQKGEKEEGAAGAAGPLEGRVENIATQTPTERVQHDNPDGRIKDMDVEGVDTDIMFPGTWASASSALDPGITTALYGAYHTYMEDYCSGYLDRLKGLMLVPGGDIDWAVAELKAHGEEEWVSCVWPVLPEGMPVDDPDLEPIWEVMNDLELPIIHHSFFYEPPYFPGYRDIWENSAIARTAAHPWGAQRLLAYVICGGILDRHPKINIGFSETGHGWLPNWLLRLDSQVHYVKGAVPPLKQLPTEYAQDGRILCAIEAHEGEKMTAAVMDILGDKCVSFASDYPHPESSWPDSVDHVLGWKGLGDARMRALMSENADRALRIV